MVNEEEESNQIKSKQNKTKQNKTKQNKTKQNKTKRNETKRNKPKQNKTKRNETKQNKRDYLCSHDVFFALSVPILGDEQVKSMFLCTFSEPATVVMISEI